MITFTNTYFYIIIVMNVYECSNRKKTTASNGEISETERTKGREKKNNKLVW